MKILKLNYMDTELDVKNTDELFHVIASNFRKDNVVKETYFDAIVERESVFPTGLETEKYGVAIPHTDIEHANKNAIGVYVLKKPLVFNQMGEEDKTIEVSIVFPLVVNDSESYMSVLSNIMNLLQDSTILESIYNAKNKETIFEIMKKSLEEEKNNE